MSLLGSYRQQEVDEFPGPDLLSDARSTLGARLARNVRYLYTEVLTRLGFAEAFDITATIATGSQATVQLPVGLAVHSFYHWLQTTWSRLVFFSPADGGHPDTAQAHVTVREFSSGLTQGVVDVPATTTGAAFAEFGSFSASTVYLLTPTMMSMPRSTRAWRSAAAAAIRAFGQPSLTAAVIPPNASTSSITA
jgi:hypothetical protein